eukprot:9522100-Prorocentrum_lima.AAC.1
MIKRVEVELKECGSDDPGDNSSVADGLRNQSVSTKWQAAGEAKAGSSAIDDAHPLSRGEQPHS